MSETGQNPEYFVRIFHTHPAGTDEFKMGLSPMADAADYHGGWGEPRLLDIADIDRASSTEGGEFDSSTASVRWRDSDGLWLARLDDLDRQILAGAEAVIAVVTRAGRFAEVEPRFLMRGPIRKYGPSGLDYVVTIEDSIGAILGRKGRDRTVQQTTIGQYFEGAPDEIKTKLVPIICGEHTDAGYTLSDGRAFSVGKIDGQYVGDYITTSTSVTPVSHVQSGAMVLPPPGPLSAVKFGGGGSHTYTYVFCARTAAGDTLPSEPLTVSGLPAPSAFSPSNGVTIFCGQYANAAWQAQVLGGKLFVKDGDANSPAPYHMMDYAGEAFSSGYDDDGDDWHYKSGQAVPTRATATITNTFTTTENVTITNARKRRMFLLADGYIPISGIFAIALTDEANSERIETPLIGPDFCTPASADWPFPNPWYEAADGHRFTVVLGEGPRADAVVQKRGTIGANVCGVTEDNTDATPMLQGAFYQLWLLLNAYVFGNGGKGYLTGDWPATAMFPGSSTIPILNYDSFETCQEYYRDRMGNAIGAIGNMIIDGATTVRSLTRRFSQEFDCYFYTNEHGQVCVGIVNDKMVTDGAQPLRDRIEIKSVGEWEILDDKVENVIVAVCNYHPALKKWVNPPETFTNQTSIDRHQGPPRKADQRSEYLYTSDPATMRSAVNHKLWRVSYAPRYLTIVVHYAPGMNLEIGQPVLVTSYKVNGADRPMLIRGHRTSIATERKQGVVTLRCLDLSRLLAPSLGAGAAIEAAGSTVQTIFASGDPRALLR